MVSPGDVLLQIGEKSGSGTRVISNCECIFNKTMGVMQLNAAMIECKMSFVHFDMGLISILRNGLRREFIKPN